jgi:hypothetical protein
MIDALTFKDFILPAIGLVGLGSGIATMYIRGTISETIITKLDLRYVPKPLCQSLHVGLAEQMRDVKGKLESVEDKVDRGFEGIRNQFFAAQTSRDEIDRHRTAREHDRREGDG